MSHQPRYLCQGIEHGQPEVRGHQGQRRRQGPSERECSPREEGSGPGKGYIRPWGCLGVALSSAGPENYTEPHCFRVWADRPAVEQPTALLAAVSTQGGQGDRGLKGALEGRLMVHTQKTQFAPVVAGARVGLNMTEVRQRSHCRFAPPVHR